MGKACIYSCIDSLIYLIFLGSYYVPSMVLEEEQSSKCVSRWVGFRGVFSIISICKGYHVVTVNSSGSLWH